MNCKMLNKQNRLLMKNEISSDYNFKWLDDDLMDTLLKKFENIYPYSSDPEEFRKSDYIKNINTLFTKKNDRKISDVVFLKKLKNICDEIEKNYPELTYQYKYKIDTYSDIVSKSNRLLINGEGGIGKSYFVYKLEEKLEEYRYNHLVLYGKFNLDIPDSIIEEIEKKNKEFYLIIDAINEYDNEKQELILKLIKRLNKKSNYNIIVTYRDNSISDKKINYLKSLLSNTYQFQGVDFDSAILGMIERYGIDFIKYLDVIETNNPLYIKMLKNIMNDPKIKKRGKLTSVLQVTFIFEQYIKDTCSYDYWPYIKNISEEMFDSGQHFISDDRLKDICGESYKDFLKKVLEQKIFTSSYYDGKQVYIFSIQKLSDYIIARTLFNRIKDKKDEEIIDIINEKIDSHYTLSEPFILLLIDKYKDKDIKKAFYYIMNTKLADSLSIDHFKKIDFNEKQIEEVQSMITFKDFRYLFMVIGGCPNRAFSCTSYLNEKILLDRNLQLNIIEKYRESEYYFRLKNIAYSIPFIKTQECIIREYFYYSFWLMSSQNERIRKLAIKCTYDILYHNNTFIDELISYYNKVCDLYIKKGIIHILSTLSKNQSVINFFNSIYNDENEIDAEIIFRVSVYLGLEDKYQLLKKKNYNKEIDENEEVDNTFDLNHIISLADIYEKYVLKFKRYTPKNELHLNNNFIINDPNEISKYNLELDKKFKCLKNNEECRNEFSKKDIDLYVSKVEPIELDSKRMFILFQEIFKEICATYNYDYHIDERFNDYSNKFSDSIRKKLLLLTQDKLLGSLMSNYYINNFIIYDDEKNIGYSNYRYNYYDDDEKIYLNAPICPFNELVDRLNMKLCDNIGLNKHFNYNWFKSVNNSVESCCKMTKPIKYDGEYWSLIGGQAHIFIADAVNAFYSCYMAFNPSDLLSNNHDARYKTIENKKYYGPVDEYIKCIYDKNMEIPDFDYDSKDIKSSCVSFPSPKLVKELNLSFNFLTSSWNNENGKIIICDTNPKPNRNYPIRGAIYMKTSVLNDLKKNNKIVYWCYTEKNYKNYRFNDKAELHLELSKTGKVVKKYNNNSPMIEEQVNKEKCPKCPYNIDKIIRNNQKYQEAYINIINNLDYLKDDE